MKPKTLVVKSPFFMKNGETKSDAIFRGDL
ncbi:hypothetical protein JOD43_002381 [Pullulanibacillus pueri]|nr:hypothetical protein [Pullulanibacillus pueri]